MSAVLYVAARAPRAGFAKTRLGRAIGHERAVELYIAFLRDLAARFASAPFAVGWYITPADAWDDIGPLIRPSERPNGQHDERSAGYLLSSLAPAGPVLIQGEGSWGERQQALFLGAAARGETRTILVASDTPHLTLEIVAEAFALLERHDLVLGLVEDGGYYLVGMRGPWRVLDGVAMSTRTVVAEIVAHAEGLGLSIAFVAPTFDVDEVADLDRLAALVAGRDDLPVTRVALERLGRPVPNGQAEPTGASTVPARRTYRATSYADITS